MKMRSGWHWAKCSIKAMSYTSSSYHFLQGQNPAQAINLSKIPNVAWICWDPQLDSRMFHRCGDIRGQHLLIRYGRSPSWGWGLSFIPKQFHRKITKKRGIVTWFGISFGLKYHTPFRNSNPGVNSFYLTDNLVSTRICLSKSSKPLFAKLTCYHFESNAIEVCLHALSLPSFCSQSCLDQELIIS